MSELKIYNTLTREKEIFKPLNAPHVGMYVCGPTLYAYAHLGNCRTFLSFDIVFRYLKHLGYKVRYVRNITDVGHLESDGDEGVVKYAKETGGKNFEGKLYVFDNRVVVDVNSIAPTIVSTCKICGTKSAHMVNCANAECNEHFVLCEDCGWKMEGCCSEACMKSTAKRVYDGTGYYQRAPIKPLKGT